MTSFDGDMIGLKHPGFPSSPSSHPSIFNTIPPLFPQVNTSSSTISGSTHPSSNIHPDLPHRDCLYIFSNHLSFVKAPKEDSLSVPLETLQTSAHLLEHARQLQERTETKMHSSVHILHIKYRFPKLGLEDEQFSSMQKKKPQVASAPFSNLNEPVVKLDIKPSGINEPSLAAAVFDHIAKDIHPPPRHIVFSYVGSSYTSGHLATLAEWCQACSPPIIVLSPVETRCRESLPLSHALGCALNITLDPDAILEPPLNMTTDIASPPDRKISTSPLTPIPDSEGNVALSPPSTWILGNSPSHLRYLKERSNLLATKLAGQGIRHKPGKQGKHFHGGALAGGGSAGGTLEALLEDVESGDKVKLSLDSVALATFSSGKDACDSGGGTVGILESSGKNRSLQTDLLPLMPSLPAAPQHHSQSSPPLNTWHSRSSHSNSHSLSSWSLTRSRLAQGSSAGPPAIPLGPMGWFGGVGGIGSLVYSDGMNVVSMGGVLESSGGPRNNVGEVPPMPPPC